MTITNKAQLIGFVNQGNEVDYLLFWGHKTDRHQVNKSCLSQWYEAPFTVDGQTFLTAEHYMMYQKAKVFGDDSACRAVLQANSPSDAKAIGRRVQGFDANVWDDHKMAIVIDVNIAKFSQHPKLSEFLLGTQSSVLVEASPVDTIWGIGLAHDHPAARDPNQWRGQNLLGFALMTVRERLRSTANT